MKLSAASFINNALIIFIAVGMQACGGGSSAPPPNAAPTASAVSITDANGSTVVVGDTLSASYTYADAESNPEGTSTFIWLRDGTAISGATASSYPLVAADSGASITLSVTPIASAGTTTGTAVVSTGVTVVNSAPTVSGVSITDDNGGTTSSGDVLSATYTYTDIDEDAEGSTTFVWLRDGVAISGATASTYTVVELDTAKSLTLSVTPVAAAGVTSGALVTSSAVSVNANPTGYYAGSAAVKEFNDNNVDLAIADIQVLINAGRLMIMSDAQAVVYDGQMTITGNDYSATLKIYKNGEIPAGAFGTTTVSGTITQGSQITGTLTGSGLGNGTFTSTYSNLNNTPADPDTIAGDAFGFRWDCYINDSVNRENLFINDLGELVNGNAAFGTVVDDCEWTGTVTPISGTALFSVDITSTINCANPAANTANSGAFTGLAITKENTNPNDRLVFTMTNGILSTGDDCQKFP